MAPPVDINSLDSLTLGKIAKVIHYDYSLAGVILTANKPTALGHQAICCVDGSKVIWLTQDEWTIITNPPNSTEPMMLKWVPTTA